MSQKVSIVTGGGRGIGLATALRLSATGHRLVIAARSEEQLIQAQQRLTDAGGLCEYVVADVGVAADVARIVEAALASFGRIDVLINNAGYAPLSPIEQMPSADYERTVAVNVSAVFHATQAVWPIMQKQGGGVIVNVSSLASDDPFPGFAVYGACKAWVNLFTKATAAEGRPHNICVYAVAPGAVETEMLRERFPDFPAEQTLAPENVAGAIELLCDERGTHAAGSTLWLRK